jgi:hypothetical protein
MGRKKTSRSFIPSLIQLSSLRSIIAITATTRPLEGKLAIVTGALRGEPSRYISARTFITDTMVNRNRCRDCPPPQCQRLLYPCRLHFGILDETHYRPVLGAHHAARSPSLCSQGGTSASLALQHPPSSRLSRNTSARMTSFWSTFSSTTQAWVGITHARYCFRLTAQALESDTATGEEQYVPTARRLMWSVAALTWISAGSSAMENTC